MAYQAQTGSIRGVVTDEDFDAPLAGVEVVVAETSQSAISGDQGNYVLENLVPATYTLVFEKDGYQRRVKGEVLVAAGQLTEADAALAGDFTEMEEFIVEDILQLTAGSETALLELRFDSPSLMDSIGSDLMSRAGASDAASALKLVSGASVQDGKYAVIRGLPDRYVSSQLNGVRLPSADEDKRAVELDQYPSTVIESLQVSKTFTPDQQGDASGGAVDVRLKGVPDEAVFKLSGQMGKNSQVGTRDDFLTYKGGGVNFMGRDTGRDIQSDLEGRNWDGAVGVSTTDAPRDYKWSMGGGGAHELEDGVKVGGFASVFYERDSSYYDDGVNDSYWVVDAGGPMTPLNQQGTSADGTFLTSLFDVTQGTQSVRWGGLATMGLETEKHSLNLTYLYSHAAEDKATLAEDTRGKEYYFPGYDRNDITHPGNDPDNLGAAPYLRTETLQYTERTTDSFQIDGSHKAPMEDWEVADWLTLEAPELDWVLAKSSANMEQPDKRQFGSKWVGSSLDPGAPPFLPPFRTPPRHSPFKPGANFFMGNLQRIWKEVDEQSELRSFNLSFPFALWSENEGYLKVGQFHDQVDRKFRQDTFSNLNEGDPEFIGDWDEYWSAVFNSEDHAILPSDYDVDYDGEQEIKAWYWMADIPLSERVNVIGGARYESTNIKVEVTPDPFATWYDLETESFIGFEDDPDAANVDFDQDDMLPAAGIVYEAVDGLTLRGSYSRTIARQTFKELTPVVQQEYLGAPIFIGNPGLHMSELENYDLRVDFVPYEGALLSASWFRKEIDEPIEYVQRFLDYSFTTAQNYPKGQLEGYEFEARQQLGQYFDSLDGLSIGGNLTLIDSEVTIPQSEVDDFSEPGIQAPESKRDMRNAPEYLYNLFATYDTPVTRTKISLFYTFQGDTLLAGAGESGGNFIPPVYALAYDTLNLGISQGLGKYLSLQFGAKNLTNPRIQTVYRSDYIDGDVRHTSYTKGIDYSIGLSLSVSF